MPRPPFEQDIIAVIWDFDKTLIPGYMQEPLFKKYGVDAARFWEEVNRLEDYYAKQGVIINKDTIYLNHILTYVKEGIFQGLNNKILEELGAELTFYPGLPEFFNDIKEQIENNERFKKFDIRLEHYVVSTGLAAMIRGSKIYKYISGLWGCEFIESPAKPGFTVGGGEQPPVQGERVITQIGYALDNTSKTRALFEINKGVNKYPDIDVNSSMREQDRRVPFSNMIYVADGPSDVPSFSIINKYGGRTYAVYPARDIRALRQVDSLRKDGRIHMYGEADYREGSQTYMWLVEHASQIAESIARRKEEAIRESVSKPPGHLM